MAKVRFKQKCRYCKKVWVLVEYKVPVICAACKIRLKGPKD